MFRDRADAAEQLARALGDLQACHPLILAIPRGGVVTGAVLADRLGGDLDVVLSRKLRAPGQPELAIGAISEDGQVHLNRDAVDSLGVTKGYLERETRYQLSEIARRRTLFRAVQPEVSALDRTVIVTDDGIATGSTLLAALETVRRQRPRVLIVAVPVAPADRLPAIVASCDRLVCLQSPADLMAVGQYYAEFPTIEDAQVVELLGRIRCGASKPRRTSAPAPTIYEGQ